MPGLTKTSREVTSVFFAKYVDSDDLCVLRCLQCYIGRTSSFRPVLHPNTPSPLLVSHHKPHRPVKSCSISRWIKSVLGVRALTLIFSRDILRGLLRPPKPDRGACLWKKSSKWLIGREIPPSNVFTIG